MVTMKAVKWVLLFAMCLIFDSANGKKACETQDVSAPLGSSVLLPCNFSSNDNNWVEWTHKVKANGQSSDMVYLNSDGHIKFLDPRSGRVKTFPNQASVRNYSIIIDALQTSDLGSYYCSQESECFELNLAEDEGKKACETQDVSAPLGSSVLLPCNFSSNDNNWVEWTHKVKANGQSSDMVHLNSDGHIKFLDPRSGRVKTFPNQASVRNYSIIIDALQTSDLGSYYCSQESECFELNLAEDEGTLNPAMKQLIYTCASLAALVLFSLVGYCCWLKNTCSANNPGPDDVIVTVSETGAGPSAPQQEIGGVNGNQIVIADNHLVYENDDQYIMPSMNPSERPGVARHQDGNPPDQSGIGIYPNLKEFKFQRVESQRTRQSFHLELISRLRQASLKQHFYANQGEIRKQQAKQGEIRKQQAMAAQPENRRGGTRVS